MRTMKTAASAAIAPHSKMSMLFFTRATLLTYRVWPGPGSPGRVERPAQRRADRVKTRTDTAVISAAKAATTARLSQAIVVTLVIPQM